MVDPITAFAAATTAISAIKQGIQFGKDIAGISGDLSKFASAMSDLNYAHSKVENPPWYKVLFGQDKDEAIDIFVKKKQAEALRAELKQYIQFAYGQSAWEELLRIEGQVRKERKQNLYRKEEIKQSILEWTLGILVALSGVGLLCFVVYYLWKKQGN